MSGRKHADSGAPTPINAGVGNLRYRSDYKNAALPPHPEDVARWQRFLAELPVRIALIRREKEGTICRTCGSKTPDVVETKRCPGCDQVLPRAAFSLRRSAPDGLQHKCKPCKGAEDQKYRLAYEKRKATRRAS